MGGWGNGRRVLLALALAFTLIAYAWKPLPSDDQMPSAARASFGVQAASFNHQVTLASVAKSGESPAPSPSPTLAATATPSPTPMPSATPLPVNGIAGSQPYDDVPNHRYEYLEAKGALEWLPEVRFVIAEGRRVGLLREDEEALWQNVLIGMAGVESVGRNFSLAAANTNWYSQGLTQLVYAHLYREENPYDPLTNLRTGLRTVLRYYRMHGNRWDWAVAQHVTGKESEETARDARDWNGTSGLDYAKRVVNIVWWANYLYDGRDVFPSNYYSWQLGGNGGFDKAPLWDIFSSPNLNYNWTAPSTSTAGYYQSRGADSLKTSPISYNTWMSVPTWFYKATPAAAQAAYQPRQPTPAEATANPTGITLNLPRQETYPRQQWAPPPGTGVQSYIGPLYPGS